MKRETGYYWVKYEDEWQVGCYDNGTWCLISDIFNSDAELSKINETRILSPDEFSISNPNIEKQQIIDLLPYVKGLIANQIAGILIILNEPPPQISEF